MRDLEALRAQVPAGVREVLQVPGLGPKKVAALWKDLGIGSPGELEYACLENRLVSLPGFGPKSQQKVLAGLRTRARYAGKLLLPAALATQREVQALLAAGPSGGSFAWAGEAGRLCPVVAGLELLVTDPASARRLAAQLQMAEAGPSRFEGPLTTGTGLRVRVVEPFAFGAAAVWFTGSEAFREALLGRLAEAGFVWGERGLSRPGAPVETPTEEAFWDAVGRTPVPPECRELPQALDEDLSGLVSEADIRGAFHVHTDWSDGGATLEEMVGAAEALGWGYVGICDHSVSAIYANGLSAERLKAQRAAIAGVQARHPGIKVFAGVESDILADGALDYPGEVLEWLDLVVASVHSRFSLDEETQTRRLVAAVSHPVAPCLGHPTGRLLLAREGYAFRWEEVVSAMARANTLVELNANPHRLDVDWTRIPGLRAAGLRIGIHPDAHSVEGLPDVKYGVWAARKGLARRADVVNALGAPEMEEYLRSRGEARP
jgi:DNA polymerase (family 10)